MGRNGNRHGRGDHDGTDDEPRAALAAELTEQAARKRLRRRIIGLLLAIVMAGAAGWFVGGMSVLSTASGEVCPNDAEYDLEGATPSKTTNDLNFTGPELTEAEAGDYYLNAVAASWQTVDDAMTTSIGDDLNATRAAAAQAATALDQTVKLLTARTWPDDVSNAVYDIANDYADQTAEARYVANATSLRYTDAITGVDAYTVSEADAYLRNKLNLPAAQPHSMPFDILDITDRGVFHSDAAGGDDRVDDGKRMVDVTVRSRVPGNVTDVMLHFDLLDTSGKTMDRVWAQADRISLAEGQAVVLRLPIDADKVTTGMGLRFTGWSVSGGSSSAASVNHNASVDAQYAKTLSVVTDFRLR
ncbi:hypothetical protein [Bifidobacterium callimiconis]|uniref:Uncharacterized protein n=1 Tax=Bifidobacterium callimiconis TaxID=2306973 RepID=A0A430FBK8_9BIFI|nr:hypothetical protein [Bifidobacterium callimiconis]MBT1177189.1 hypothetical protein [Bifidobacterium callimiconis]RSX50235.1 hypothetical protein D2E23_1783 [Bifidobacterium callimiconis]